MQGFSRMPHYFCKACGIRYPESAAPPSHCMICEDDRQFVPRAGQEWVTPDELAVGRFNAFREVAPGLFGLWTMPQFAIGQRAFLVTTPAGNILWDCVSFLDKATIEIVKAFGGIKAVAVSHPHFYSAMASWGRAFDCPVFVHEADRNWVVDPDPCLEFWKGDTRELLPGVTLHRIGGHFPGNAVLHLAERRALLSGDTVLVTWDRRHVSFMWSYPNYVPLPAKEVERIGHRLDALDFDALHSAFWGRGDIERDAKTAIERSVKRHIHGPNVPMDVGEAAISGS
jgi:glyoxylase-like metal-dependent hydrolase (beta-lactamase superfamily II)